MINMKTHHFLPIVVGVIIIVSMNSCTKTVTDVKTVDSTVVDTIGRGFIRFVSMFPPSAGTEFQIFNADTTPFTYASNTLPGSYFPVSPNLPLTLYGNIPFLGGLQFMPLPAPGPTMNTYALFLFVNSQGDSTLQPIRSIDSEKFTPPPPGYCYIRLINGIPDSPGPFFVDLDTVDSSIFSSHSKPQSTPAFSFSSYALIPAGQHTIFLRIDDSNDPQTEVPFQTSYRFDGGQYYSVLATGSLTNGSIVVDQE